MIDWLVVIGTGHFTFFAPRGLTAEIPFRSHRSAKDSFHQFRCIGWCAFKGSSRWTKGAISYYPVEEIMDAQDSVQAISAFQQSRPHLKNITAHPISDYVIVKHKGPQNLPIAISSPQAAKRGADGTPTSRGMDAALQIEPPETLTAQTLAGCAGEGATTGNSAASPMPAVASHPLPDTCSTTRTPPQQGRAVIAGKRTDSSEG